MIKSAAVGVDKKKIVTPVQRTGIYLVYRKKVKTADIRRYYTKMTYGGLCSNHAIKKAN
jgi:hypothetical protein